MAAYQRILGLLLVALIGISGLPGIALADHVREARPPLQGAADAFGMFRGNPARTGVYPGHAPLGPASITRRIDLGARSFNTPGVGDGIAVVSSGGDTLRAIALSSGKALWNIPHAISYSSALIEDGVVYIGSWGEGFKALDAATGDPIWVFHSGAEGDPEGFPGDAYDSSAALVDGTLYVTQGPYSGLFALDPATGKEQWRFTAPGGMVGSPAVADGVVYVVTETAFDPTADGSPSSVYAVDALDGTERWHTELPAGMTSFNTPAVSDDTVVVGAGNPDAGAGTYFALDTTSGEVRWTFDIVQPMWSASAAISDGIAILPGAESGAVFGVDLATGEKVWTYDAAWGFYSQPAVADGVVYLSGENGKFAAVDVMTGEVSWILDFGAGGGSPTIAGGHIYYTSGSFLYVLGDADDPAALTLPAQPAQPANGPGGSSTLFPDVKITHFGPTPGGWDLFEPTYGTGASAKVAEGPFSPLPLIISLNGCCDAAGYTDSIGMRGILTHLAQNGAVVVVPIYNADTVMEDTFAAVEAAVSELAKPGHPEVDFADVGVLSHSFGGTPSVLYTAGAEERGLPVPTALYIDAGCEGDALGCPTIPTDLTLPAGIKIVLTYNEDDPVVTVDNGERIWAGIVAAGVPESDRSFVFVHSDDHGMPVLIADHDVIQVENALRWYGTGRLADALFACAFSGQACEQALGDGPDTVAMGEWGDGVAITTLTITDDPAELVSPPAS